MKQMLKDFSAKNMQKDAEALICPPARDTTRLPPHIKSIPLPAAAKPGMCAANAASAGMLAWEMAESILVFKGSVRKYGARPMCVSDAGGIFVEPQKKKRKYPDQIRYDKYHNSGGLKGATFWPAANPRIHRKYFRVHNVVNGQTMDTRRGYAYSWCDQKKHDQTAILWHVLERAVIPKTTVPLKATHVEPAAPPQKRFRVCDLMS